MSSRKPQKQYLSIGELATEIGVSTSVLYALMRDGKLPGASRIGQRIIVHLATFTKAMGHDVDEPETPATQEPAKPRLVDPFQVAEAVAAELRPPKKVEERANQEPLQAWTELPALVPVVKSDKYQYYNSLSQRNIPAEIIDRIQALRSEGLRPSDIRKQMEKDRRIAVGRGVNSPPVPKYNSISRHASLYDQRGFTPKDEPEEVEESIQDLFRRAAENGVNIWLEKGNIAITKDAEDEPMPPALLASLKARMPEIVAYLGDNPMGNIPVVEEVTEAAEEPRHVVHTDVVSWPDTDDGTELFRIGDQSEHNVGETARVAIRLAFTCINCKEVKEREEKLVLSVCRPGRRDIEKDIVSYALCGTKCAKEFIDQKDEAEWLNTPIGRQLTTEELKAEGWIEVPTFSTPENTETSGSLWRKLRNLVDGNE